MRGRLSKAMQLRHPAAPVAVQWHSGALLLLGGPCMPATQLRAGYGREGVGSSFASAEIALCGLPLCCAGVLLPRGVQLTNGSWSPRHDW